MDREDNNIESLFQDLVKESGYTGRQTEVIHPHVSDVSFRVNEAINVLRGNIQLSGSYLFHFLFYYCGHFKKNYLMNLRILDLEKPFGKPQKL